MANVFVEVDIAADGSITARPNPVEVSTGDRLTFHVNSNLNEEKFPLLRVDFAQGADSPFPRFDSPASVTAKFCRGLSSSVNWPNGVSESSVTLEAHGSPAGPATRVLVHRTVPKQAVASGQIVHNYYFCCRCCEDHQ